MLLRPSICNESHSLLRSDDVGKADSSLILKGRTRADMTTGVGFLVILLFFLGSGYASYSNIEEIRRDADRVVKTHQSIMALDNLLSVMKDAETGQRGYLLTGEDSYLVPYREAQAALPQALVDLSSLTAGDSIQTARLGEMRKHIDAKMAELAKTILLRRTKGFDAAHAVVVTDLGKNEMDDLRSAVETTEKEDEAERDRRLSEMAGAYRNATVSALLAAVLGIVVSAIVATLLRRAAAAQEREEWLQTGMVGLATAVFGEQRIEQLSNSVLSFLAGYLDAQVGAFYSTDGYSFGRTGSYGIPEGAKVADRFQPGEGLHGQAVQDNRSFVLNEIPNDYLPIGSALGQTAPKHLAICLAKVDGAVNAVFELGFLHPPNPLTLVLLEDVSKAIGIAVRTALDRSSLEDFNEEVTRQNEELQTQSEELRVSNEELEEQGRALRESQARLELQQVELEQSNSQLEEQTQLLESERDSLTRVQSELQTRARELDQATRYKSDFLANMSHELRTPLNSSLILAGVLAENREGNLTPDQVTYAQTIREAGNDLLNLINDILDLSKIEAGRMELQVEDLRIDRILDSVQRTFGPIAEQKGLVLKTEAVSDVPPSVRSDSQRLQQVLKNLVSNAVKFTAAGEISVRALNGPDDTVTFQVSDTGIGIPSDKQEAVFGAFQQADSTTSRKYGGTGLGLSICRELAHLLRGSVSLVSEPDQGSTFSFTIPRVYGEPATPVTPPVAIPLHQPPSTSKIGPGMVSDDRERLGAHGRCVLVVEDDVSFAKILYEVAHEHGFDCLVAGTAEEAIQLVQSLPPNAILLDVGLPDESGLSVLDQLKRNPNTRHIPVHVVTASDYDRAARTLGAVGYLIKPVSHEEISSAFQSLQERLDRRIGRVLVVEDDIRQLESIKLLLGTKDVQTIGVSTAEECLRELQNETFDCMVVDLNLPGASGLSLLETLSSSDEYSFPPVIVYTGRDLAPDQEQQLRKYSQSIIVKGAKSPERLLDEVTLFLHQVVSELPKDKQRLLEQARDRDTILEHRTILIAEDDVRNVFALTSILEQRGAKVVIARNGLEALAALESSKSDQSATIDLVLMDVMMPQMDGLTAIREIRKKAEWKSLPIIALTAKAMRDDQETCLAAGANDYMAKPLDVDKLLSLLRVWISR